MTFSPRYIAVACAALLLAAAPQIVRAQNFSPAQRGEIERVVHDYLIAHPEVLQEAMSELEKRQTAAEAEKHDAAVKENAKLLFSSPNQVTLGNPNGNVTFVEFFDYNCGYCKRAMSDMLTLLKDDPKLKVVLKEFPVLGPGSVEAAHVAVAVRMQDKTGKKYLEFHQKLLGGRGPADLAHALAVAKEVGLDMDRLEKDMKSPEVKTTLDEDFRLARGARPQRHAELRDRLQRGGRRHRACRFTGTNQYRALRQTGLLTAAGHSSIIAPIDDRLPARPAADFTSAKAPFVRARSCAGGTGLVPRGYRAHVYGRHGGGIFRVRRAHAPRRAPYRQEIP